MKETKIIRVPAGEVVSHSTEDARFLSDLEKDITQKDFITSEEIKEYARMTAQQFEDMKEGRERYTLIVDALSVERIKNMLSSRVKAKITDEELSDVLSPVRDKIIYELGNYLEPDEYFFITQNFTPKGSRDDHFIFQVTGIPYKGEKIYRENKRTAPISREHQKAIRKLSQLEKNPGIVDISLYSAVDEKIICEKLNIVTLYDVMKNSPPEKSEYTFSHVLGSLVDAVESAIFLKENKLMMQDISTDNIGMQKDNKRGIFFDLDGVFPLGVKLGSRVKKPEYCPPELQAETKITQPVTSEKEMVYQFGVVLKKILDWGFASVPQNLEDKIDVLVDKMIEKNPTDRYDLHQAYKQLIMLEQECTVPKP